MPPQPGEELALSAFADARYYMNAPSSRPQHDRFVRGVYLYIFYDTNTMQARLELANEPGTEYQDAVTGLLSSTTLSYSDCQPNLFSITVGEAASWHISCHDMRRESYRLHRLQAIDLYLWSAEDCVKLVSLCKQYMAPGQLRLDEKLVVSRTNSLTMHTESTVEPAHPVVQRLERAATAEQFRRDQSEAHGPGAASPSYRAIDHADNVQHSPAPATQPAAYNPAAPGRPETLTERQKTPPPMDASAGNGLKAATLSDRAVNPHSGLAPSMGGNLVPTSPGVGLMSSSMVGLGQKELPRLPNVQLQYPTIVPPPPPPPSLPPSGPLPSPAARHDSVSDHHPTAMNSPPTHVGKTIDPGVETMREAMNPPSWAIQAAMNPPPEFVQAAMNPPQEPFHAAMNPPPEYFFATLDPHAKSHHSAIHQQFYRPTSEELDHGQGHGGAHRSLSQAMGFSSSASKATDAHHSAQDSSSPKKIEAKISRFDKTVNKWIKKMEKV